MASQHEPDSLKVVWHSVRAKEMVLPLSFLLNLVSHSTFYFASREGGEGRE